MQDKWMMLGLLGLVAFFFSVISCHCLLAIFWPKAAWFLQEGWKFKGAQPSTWSLVSTRIRGFFGLGVIGLLFALLIMSSRSSNRTSSPVVKPPTAPNAMAPK